MLIYDQNHDKELFYIEKTATLNANKKIYDMIVDENNVAYMFGENEAEETIKVDGELIIL